jgi:hypothetical protein
LYELFVFLVASSTTITFSLVSSAEDFLSTFFFYSFFLASLELERAANPFPDEEYFIIVWSELGKEKKSSQIRVERGIDTNQKEKEREAVDVLR